MLAVERGLGPTLCAPHHDALYLECDDAQAGQVAVELEACFSEASNAVLNGRVQLRVETGIVRYPDHYDDDDGEEIWDMVMDFLRQKEGEEQADPQAELETPGQVLLEPEISDRQSRHFSISNCLGRNNFRRRACNLLLHLLENCEETMEVADQTQTLAVPESPLTEIPPQAATVTPESQTPAPEHPVQDEVALIAEITELWRLHTDYKGSIKSQTKTFAPSGPNWASVSPR